MSITHSEIQVRRYEDFVGIRICPQPRQVPRTFHIAFLLDTSGSMQGERIATVKQTLSLFLDRLQEGDRVTLISYNSVATLVQSAESDVGTLRQSVASLKAGGGTNLEDAILKLAALPTLASVDAVFLLTDGEVNQGILSNTGLSHLVQCALFTSHRMPIYTVGYGADHNATLLQRIAMTTRSSYTYAESSELVPSVVGTILVAMREEVTKAAELEWGGEAECWEWGCEKGARKYCIGALIADKPQWVILKGKVISLRLSWKGLEGDSLPLPIPRDPRDPRDPTEIKNDDSMTVGNLEVLEQSFRARAACLFADLSDPGIPPMVALPKLQDLEDSLVASPVATAPLVLRIRAEIAERRVFYDTPCPILGDDARDQLSRFASRASALANQRGDSFASPTQRHASQQMVHAFQHSQHSQQTQDPE